MVSKNQTKLIKSLQQKKYRNKYGLFTAEGLKVVEEFLNSSYTAEKIYCTDPVIVQNKGQIAELVSEAALKKISSLTSPNKVLALFKIPEVKKEHQQGLKMVLDDIRDPGNLGTIIRLCDWFGITEIICSTNTVDCYNSKVVQASMGSLARVNIKYADIALFLSQSKEISYVTDMEGENIYSYPLEASGNIVLGNEANGVSEHIKQLCNHKIAIPRFGKLKKTESLNVATATAIVLSEFRRRGI